MPDLPPIVDLASARALFRALRSAACETVGIAYLDPKRRILGLRHVAGGHGHVGLSIRRIAADALVFDAVAVLIAHNHPSGDARPSERDLAFTRELARGLAALEVDLVDHLVIAGETVTSLRADGAL